MEAPVLTAAPGAPLISFGGVHKSYGDNRVLQGVDLQVFPGETMGILGRSGSGKTVLTSMLVGLTTPDRGSIEVAGLQLSSFKSEADWRRNASVLIHEATHQSAFNTGIHSRYAPPPKWLAEGLAMLFEAPGVHDSRNYTQLADRVNRDRLRAFRQSLLPRHRPELLAAMVASDGLFGRNPPAAYAEAWAMSFFLVESEPAKYVRYLKLTAARPPFAPYTAAQRTADFTAIFGGDWRMLEARLLRFMAELP